MRRLTHLPGLGKCAVYPVRYCSKESANRRDVERCMLVQLVTQVIGRANATYTSAIDLKQATTLKSSADIEC